MAIKRTGVVIDAPPDEAVRIAYNLYVEPRLTVSGGRWLWVNFENGWEPLHLLADEVAALVAALAPKENQ